MNDLVQLERLIAGVAAEAAGPSRPVDVVAITRAATTQSPQWSVHPMFSATRFVTAGVLVALFGAFLLAGVLTQPSEEFAPAAGSPSPTADLLSTFDTEEVSPGVFRVLGDGHRDLRASVWDVAVSGSGDVWVDLIVDGASRVARLGLAPDYELNADDVSPPGTDLSVDHDGSVRARLPQRPDTEMRFDGATWIPAEARLAVGGAWTGDAVEGDGFWTSPARGRGGLEVVRQSADGDEPVYVDLNYPDPVPNLNDGFGLTDAGGAVLAASASDGTIWVSLSTPGSGRFQLAKFDGMTFDRVDTGGSAGPSRAALQLDDSGQNVLTDIAEAPDGTLWVQRWQRHADILYVWAWDGSDWTEYGPIATKAGARWSEVWAGPDGYPGAGPRTGIRFQLDGSIWFDGLVHFDGERFDALDAPVTSADGTTVLGAVSVAPDGTIWIVMVGGYGSDDCQTSITCGTRSEGLYAITPEAVAASES